MSQVNAVINNSGSDLYCVGIQQATSIMVSGAKNGSICFWDCNTMKINNEKKVIQIYFKRPMKNPLLQ